MDYIFIDAGQLASPQTAHAYLAQKLVAPPHYGKNLDALYDVVCPLCRSTTFVLYAAEPMAEYACRVARVLRDAAQENPHLRVEQWGAPAVTPKNAGREAAFYDPKQP